MDGFSQSTLMQGTRKDIREKVLLTNLTPCDGLTAFKVDYDNGESIITSMAEGTTWEAAYNYYVGKTFTYERPNGEEIVFQDGPHGTPAILLADANLIAAAPDLYDALRRLMSYADSPCGGCGNWVAPDLVFDAARAALSKANGEVTA
jgi:hypothetical protein